MMMRTKQWVKKAFLIKVGLIIPVLTFYVYGIDSDDEDYQQFRGIDYKPLFEKLGERESGGYESLTRRPAFGNYRENADGTFCFDNQYAVVNHLGFMGKYQIGEALLIDLGYYEADDYYAKEGSERRKCEWDGRWRKKAKKEGVRSQFDFLANKKFQKKVVRKEFARNKKVIEQRFGDLSENRGRCNLDDRYTIFGILAATHLVGVWGVAATYHHNRFHLQELSDEINTAAEEYADLFSN